LFQQGDLGASVACCRQALAIDFNHALAHYNLGVALTELDQRAEAVACYRQAMRLNPAYAEAHFNLGQLLLLEGNFARGWPEYDWWRRLKGYERPSPGLPLWDGSALKGRTILLLAEQGHGDTIQAIRYASQIKQTGGTVVLACPATLERLVRTAPGIDQVVSLTPPYPDADVYAPLMSLPALLRTTLETIPAPVPYLFPDPELVAEWRQELGQRPGYKVGIAWQGDPKHKRDRWRSIPLSQFAPLAEVPGVQLYSLQVGAGREQLEDIGESFNVVDLGCPASITFADRAAAMSCLDLIVTVDTAFAHLAGAQGLPVWVALPFVSEWRWLLDREDSPWYPTMRLFRQKERGNWTEVFERMARALAEQRAGG
jgi:hypothetical protein